MTNSPPAPTPEAEDLFIQSLLLPEQRAFIVSPVHSSLLSFTATLTPEQFRYYQTVWLPSHPLVDDTPAAISARLPQPYFSGEHDLSNVTQFLASFESYMKLNLLPVKHKLELFKNCVRQNESDHSSKAPRGWEVGAKRILMERSYKQNSLSNHGLFLLLLSKTLLNT